MTTLICSIDNAVYNSLLSIPLKPGHIGRQRERGEQLTQWID